MSTDILHRDTGSIASLWWAMVIRGLVAIVFGIAIFARPIATMEVLMLLFGAYALATGTLAVVAALHGVKILKYWWALLIEGLVGVIVGFIAFFWPGITALALYFTIATWALVTGIFQVVGAISGFGWASSRVLQGFAGALSIILGVLLFRSPGFGAVTLLWFLGIYALVVGVDHIVLGLQINRIGHRLQHQV